MTKKTFLNRHLSVKYPLNLFRHVVSETSVFVVKMNGKKKEEKIGVRKESCMEIEQNTNEEHNIENVWNSAM